MLARVLAIETAVRYHPKTSCNRQSGSSESKMASSVLQPEVWSETEKVCGASIADWSEHLGLVRPDVSHSPHLPLQPPPLLTHQPKPWPSLTLTPPPAPTPPPWP